MDIALRSLLASHALDNISLCSSDDETCSIASDLVGSPRSSRDEADFFAIVKAPEDLKVSTSNKLVAKSKIRSARPKQQVPAAPVPAKPLKWQTRLADRATAAVNLEAHYQMPPHVLFDLLADPFQHEKIFDAIEAADAELLEESGGRRKWRLDYTARWNFWKVSGVCENRLFMWTDRDAGTVTFKLREPGFLRKYEGTWTIKAACGTPMADCYPSADVSSSSSSSCSSSRASSPASSPPSSPRAGWGWVQSGGGNSSMAGGSVVNSWDNGGGAAQHGGMRLSPMASVSAAAASAGFSGLTGAVAAIARMQAGWQESVSNSVTNFSSLGSHISNSNSSSSQGGALGGLQLPHIVPDRVGQALARISSPLGGIAAGLGIISSSRGGADAAAASDRDQQRRRAPRQLPSAAIIIAETLTSPRITPPYPLNQALKVQSKGQVEDMIEGLVRAAALLQTGPLTGV